jgi:hypothetical protein
VAPNHHRLLLRERAASAGNPAARGALYGETLHRYGYENFTEGAGQIWPRPAPPNTKEVTMHEIIYLVGLVVVVMFILSLLGLR